MRPDYYKDCTVECERMPTCATCDKTKAPRGRSVPMECARGYCDSECPGYFTEPTPGHLWPGEIADMDREPESDQ